MKPRRFLIILLPSLSLAAAPSGAEVLERIIAKVNGEIITLSEFQARQIAALRQARVTPDRQEAFLREHNRELLDAAIDEALIAQQAQDSGQEVSEEYLKQVIDSIKKEYNIQSEDEFQRRIREEGLTIDEIKRDIRRSLLTRRFVGEEVERKVVVSDSELRAEYEMRRLAEFTTPPTDRLSEILIVSREPEALKRAEELVARLRAGEDFAALARAHSTAPTRSSGGDLGSLARRSMNASLAEVVGALQIGQVSDPIPVKGGYRIIKVVSREVGQQKPFEEVVEKLREELRERRIAASMEALTKRLREHASIEEMVREVPLEVQVDTSEPGGQPSLGDAVNAVEAGPAASDEEFVSTPGRVRRVAPPSGGSEPPAPASPTPTPRP